MNPMLNIAVRAAHRAGDFIERSLELCDTLDVSSKSHNDFVSDVDRHAEKEIIEILKKAYPEHSILAEESGAQQGNEYQWIIDPLDGTTNFLHGLPQFAVSIALLHKGRLEVAVIYDPMRRETFTANRGGGAKLNDRKLRVTKRRSLDGALLGTGFPYSDFSYLDTYMETLKALIPKTAGIRRPGSAALDLAYVAAGRIDGFWEFNLKSWDIAAGVLIIQEAGGIVTDFSGGENYLESGNIVAGSPKVFHGILSTIKPLLPEKFQR